MNKIDFKDLPDTTTPINAENLNQIQTNVENAIKRNIISSLASSLVTATTTGDLQVPITNSNKVGDKFTISNNRIYVGAGVSKVLVSASVYCNLASGRGSAFNLAIKKNGTVVMGQTTGGSDYGGTNKCLVASPKIISVSQGDYFDYYVYTYNGDKIRSDTGYTYLTIEMLE